jgi:hypothetical protein
MVKAKNSRSKRIYLTILIVSSASPLTHLQLLLHITPSVYFPGFRIHHNSSVTNYQLTNSCDKQSL